VSIEKDLNARARWDSWINSLTGLGGARDKSTAVYFEAPCVLSHETLEALYAGDDLARRIVEGPIPDALRQGVTLEGDDEGKLAAEASRLDAWEGFLRGLIWGRLHGGGFLYLGLRSGRQDEPLDLDAVRPGDLQWVMDLDRHAVTPVTWYVDPSSPKFGQPETYLLSPPNAGGATARATGTMVHESRLIRFPGVKTTRRRRASLNGFDDPALLAAYPVLRDVNTIWRSGVYAAQDLSQGVFKVRGLVDMIAEGQREVLLRRMEIVDLARSVARSVVLDAEGEDFTTVDGKGLGTLPAVLDKAWSRLAAAAGMPVTVLMGISPSGLNATGESDIRLWYDRVAAYRRDVVEPRARVLIDVLARSAGVDPEGISIAWPSLWQPTDKETAELRKLTADTDAIYIDKGVLLPEEVALSRWGSGAYSTEITGFDPEIRQALADAELEDMAKGEEPEGQEPEEPSEPSEPSEPTPVSEPIDPGTDVPAPDSTLNGAQMKGMQDTIVLVAEGKIPKETGVQILLLSLPVDEAAARAMLAPVVETYRPTYPAEPAPDGTPPADNAPPG
jgi:phage-related protein (TIGR01555 family)